MKRFRSYRGKFSGAYLLNNMMVADDHYPYQKSNKLFIFSCVNNDVVAHLVHIVHLACRRILVGRHHLLNRHALNHVRVHAWETAADIIRILVLLFLLGRVLHIVKLLLLVGLLAIAALDTTVTEQAAAEHANDSKDDRSNNDCVVVHWRLSVLTLIIIQTEATIAVHFVNGRLLQVIELVVLGRRLDSHAAVRLLAVVVE